MVEKLPENFLIDALRAAVRDEGLDIADLRMDAEISAIIGFPKWMAQLLGRRTPQERKDEKERADIVLDALEKITSDDFEREHGASYDLRRTNKGLSLCRDNPEIVREYKIDFIIDSIFQLQADAVARSDISENIHAAMLEFPSSLLRHDAFPLRRILNRALDPDIEGSNPTDIVGLLRFEVIELQLGIVHEEISSMAGVALQTTNER